MHAFDALSDPIRRRTLEFIAQRERASGEIVKVVGAEFEISQSAISQHLRVLRESGLASVRKEGAKRCYSINPEGFNDVEAWLDQLRHYWGPKLAALATEVERGNRTKRR